HSPCAIHAHLGYVSMSRPVNVLRTESRSLQLSRHVVVDIHSPDDLIVFDKLLDILFSGYELAENLVEARSRQHELETLGRRLDVRTCPPKERLPQVYAVC